jgi:hypothetical protein
VKDGGEYIYLQDSVAGDPPVLCIGDRRVHLPEGTALLWLKILADFIWRRGIGEKKK